MKLFVYVLVLAIGVALVETNPRVTTKSGIVQGITKTTPTGKVVDAFLGIPYAEPPTGHNRFLPPIQKKPWNSVLVADTLPKSCYQTFSAVLERLKWAKSDSEMSEDCLYLNIWVPNSKIETRTAVMVWIHGGGYAFGSSNLELYDGATLAAEQNVIVVSLNYRLNVFGFLNIEQTSVTGNMGFLDQVEALKWIHENVDTLGGDPQRVTIFGESAGGASVSQLLISPLSEGLFQNAIVQSGPPDVIKATPVDPKDRDRWFAGLNCTQDEGDQEDCVRKTTAELLVSNTDKINTFLFRPVPKDGRFLQKNINTYLKERDFHHVNVLLGFTENDGALLSAIRHPETDFKEGQGKLTRSDMLQIVQKSFPNAPDIAHKVIVYLYTDWGRVDDPEAIRVKISDMETDVFFACDTIELAKGLTEAGREVYMYQFSHIPSNSKNPRWMGATHGDEIQFVFGVPLHPNRGYQKEEEQLAKKIMTYWANFAKYGNPNEKETENTATKVEQWPKYTLRGKKSINLDLNMTTNKAVRARECAFWQELLPEIIHSFENIFSVCSINTKMGDAKETCERSDS